MEEVDEYSGNRIDVICHASFKGIDGEGTCNIACQWYPKNGDCVMWTPEE